MAARLDEIAKQAGVSKSTVSRVLNERPGVSARARMAVLAAIESLGYERPSVLRPRSFGLVGLIVPELQNPIFPIYAEVIESNLARQGFTTVLGTMTPEGSGEDEYVGMLLDRKVSGIVFVSGLHADTLVDRSRYDDLARQGVPFVLVNGAVPGLAVPSLSCDDALAGQLAVQHLAGLGHRRIGFISGPDRYTPVQRRLAGFRLAMHRHVGPGTADLIELTSFDIAGGQAAATRLLDRGATALVCGNDLMALGAIRAVRRHGLRVPEDVSVIGADDSPLMAYTDPALTTVRHPVLAIGAAAARALADRIKGRAHSTGEQLFDPELVIRASTGPCPDGRP